jgi:hypothetical protein
MISKESPTDTISGKVSYMGFRKSMVFFPPGPHADETLHEMRGDVINEIHQTVTGRFLELLDFGGSRNMFFREDVLAMCRVIKAFGVEGRAVV